MVKPIKPAFFIDGQMEKLILQRLKIDAPIRITGLNGKKVTIPAIAKKIAPSIRLLQRKHDPIIILIDREGRAICSKKIISELHKELEKNGANKNNLIIGVADRMIENWILADWDNFVSITEINAQSVRPSSFEGMYGKRQLKKYYPFYQETTDGPKLFCNAKASIIKKNSKSFFEFISPIMSINCNCIWLTR